MSHYLYDLGGDLFVEVESRKKQTVASIKKATQSSDVKGGQSVRVKTLVSLCESQFKTLTVLKSRVLTEFKQNNQKSNNNNNNITNKKNHRQPDSTFFVQRALPTPPIPHDDDDDDDDASRRRRRKQVQTCLDPNDENARSCSEIYANEFALTSADASPDTPDGGLPVTTTTTTHATLPSVAPPPATHATLLVAPPTHAIPFAPPTATHAIPLAPPPSTDASSSEITTPPHTGYFPAGMVVGGGDGGVNSKGIEPKPGEVWNESTLREIDNMLSEWVTDIGDGGKKRKKVGGKGAGGVAKRVKKGCCCQCGVKVPERRNSSGSKSTK